MSAPPQDTGHDARIARIQEMLSETARDGSESQPARFAAPEAGAARILALADRSVLPQSLRLNLDGRAITLDAANRRVLRLRDPNPADQPAAVLALCVPGVLGPEDADRLLAGLIAFCDGASSLRIARATGTAPDPSETGGIPADALRRAPQVPPPLPDRAQAFLTTLGTAAVPALLQMGPEPQVLAGSQAEADRLAIWAAPVLDRVLDEAFPLSASFETDGAYVFDTGEADGAKTLVACVLGDLFIAQVAGRTVPEILSAWRLPEAD